MAYLVHIINIKPNRRVKMRIGKYNLENDIEFKVIPDGYEISGDTVDRLNIKPETIHTANGLPVSAHWGFANSIIVEPRG